MPGTIVDGDKMDDANLIREFVDTFAVLDDLTIFAGQRELRRYPSALITWDETGEGAWRPLAVETSRVTLEGLYQSVPGPFPGLYETLVLSYQWAEVDLGRLRLLENLPPALQGLTRAITADAFLFRVLTQGRFVPFGKGPDYDYDPVCFDLSRRDAEGDCPIVKFDHEEILIKERLVVVKELAPSFRELMNVIIEDARQKRADTRSI
jgi:hypothetical protein